MTDHLLLDTCAAIWVTEGEPIAPPAMAALEQADRIAVSPITAWEIGLLVSRGRLRLRNKPHSWYKALTGLPGVAEAELTAEILIDVSYLPGQPHNDPADRIIMATARLHDMTVMTRDRAILDYAAQGYLRAIEC